MRTVREQTARRRGGIAARMGLLAGVVLATLLAGAEAARAAQVTLAWDANTDSDLAGYKIHYGEASGSYTIHVDVGKVTTWTVTGLADGRTYYFVGTAYDTAGNESAYSNEVVYSVPGVPSIGLLGNGQAIANGDTTPATADGTDFGSATTGSGVTRTFTIRNDGSGALNLTGSPRVSISGAQAADFSVSAQPPSPVAAGGSGTFQVTFTPSATGLRSATVSIVSNDAARSPYTFAVSGTGTPPPETVSAPAAPTGPASGFEKWSYGFTAGGAVSSYGDPVQYQIDWGDGTNSGWLASGTVTASRTWQTAGSYQVRAKARCATHTTVESALGPALAVTIVRDTVPPAAPRGLRVGP